MDQHPKSEGNQLPPPIWMKIASVAEVKAHFSAYLRASEQGPVVVTRNVRDFRRVPGLPIED